MTGSIPFPGRGIGHMDAVGDIPIGPARLFGVIEMPPVIGDTETTYGNISFSCRGIGHTDLFSIIHTPVIGDIPILPARLFGEPIMPPVIGNMETPPALGDSHTPPALGDMETTYSALLTGVIPIGTVPATYGG